MRQKSGENKCQVGGNSSGCGTGAAESQTSHFPRQAATDARYVKIDKTDTSDAKIGDGAYGVVYRALDKVLNEKVALKRIKLENEEGETIFINTDLHVVTSSIFVCIFFIEFGVFVFSIMKEVSLRQPFGRLPY